MPNSNRNWKQKIWIIIRNLMIIFFVTSIGWTILARFVPVIVTPLMIIRSVEALVDSDMPKNSKKWVPINDISKNMIVAVIAAEDNKFMYHHGFSFEDMQKAFKHNQKGKRIRGGSTISQQTAKNVFLWHKRSYLRKGLEAYFTVLIEIFWSKERIMEVYLNSIEMGDGIYGVEAASLEYFGVHASDLSKNQAALIAVCLPNPRKYSPVNPSSYISRRKNAILSVMRKLPKINIPEDGKK